MADDHLIVSLFQIAFILRVLHAPEFHWCCYLEDNLILFLIVYISNNTILKSHFDDSRVYFNFYDSNKK